MRILHTADLHIGKVVNGYSMLEEQAYALDQIIATIKEYAIDVLIIAGDVYDKRYPSDQASKLFNDFLSNLLVFKIPVLIIAGNHDAGVKLEFGKEIFAYQDLHIEGQFNESLKQVTINDEYGVVNFYLAPFMRPSDLRLYTDDVTSYHEALAYVIDQANIDKAERNLFIGHQFFASGSESISDSEQISVGGIENVGYQILSDFDYAALGHLHRPQRLMSDFIRYSGSIVKYSLSEVNDNKSLVLIELKEKGDITYELLPLKSLREFKHIKGYLADILSMDKTDDYVFVTLLDDDVLDAISKLKTIFTNLMTLDFDNKRTQANATIDLLTDIEDLSASQLFKEFYALFNNSEMSESQAKIVEQIMERIDQSAS
ncbi:MAG: exonuclease SbcCD subunit D [Erysipelothrix sp.]|nr:exonuclease SbcCD subunit D [Erysipelothrix sp.]